MRVVVTGGAGFIGSAVCRYLVAEARATVLNIDKLSYAASLASLDLVSSSPRYSFRRADITNAAHIAALFEAFEPNSIIHLAAETHVDRSIGAAADFVDTNIVGTCRLLDAARTYWSALPRSSQARFRFIHVSTDEVYGSLGPIGRFSELSCYDPSSPYAASKAASDHLVMAWHRTYGLPAIVTHCSNNYGPYQFPEKFVPLMIVNAIESKPLPVYGDGANIRDWLHVDDHARALCLMLTRGRPGEVYNVGGRSERTNLAVVETITALVDDLRPALRPRKGLITFVEDRPGHDRRYAVDPTKLETELGWRAEVGFEGGLRKTVRWYLENESWWRPLRETRYAGERLGVLTHDLVA